MDGKAMQKISYGLYVLTSRLGDKDNGCIINTATQITTTPNRLSICVNKQNLTYEMIMKTGIFNISVLSEKAIFEQFTRFGFQSGRNADKFFGYSPIRRADNGVLYVTENTSAFISAQIMHSVDVGTHMLFISDVTDCGILSNDAPATYAYYHSNIKPKPEKTEKKGFRCKICGYIHEGSELPADFVCPICKHGAEDFEII